MKRMNVRSQAVPTTYLTLRTGLRAQKGAIPIPAWCYSERNRRSWNCAWAGWPAEVGNDCWGNRNEVLLMDCLKDSRIENWYQNFSGCTSDAQCFQKALDTHKKMTGHDSIYY